MIKRNGGQVAIEFLMYVGVAFFIVLALMATIFTLSENNARTRAYNDADDLGKSLQQEFLLAAKLEDGYVRRINLPMTLDGKAYNITLGQSDPAHSYMILGYESSELYFLIPPITGNITLGNNMLRKNNGTLYISQI